MRPAFKSVAAEALFLTVLGLAIGLLANLASPRGLSLTRDYFPRIEPPVGGKMLSPTLPAAGTNSSAPSDAVWARLLSKGLQPIDREATVQLFHDPQYEEELIVFVDARDDRHYQEGHVPGAYQFDRYYPERYLPSVLPACLNAAKVVVYCTGGDCEDSEFAAVALQEAGIPPERIFIFAGGVREWAAYHLPLETGARKSGNLLESKP